MRSVAETSGSTRPSSATTSAPSFSGGEGMRYGEEGDSAFAIQPSVMIEPFVGSIRQRNGARVGDKVFARLGTTSEPFAEALADHEARKVRVRARDRGHDARVGDEEIAHAAH